MSTFRSDNGILTIDDKTTAVRFTVEFSVSLFEITSAYHREVLCCVPQRARLIGTISEVVITLELRALMEHLLSGTHDGLPLFTVSGPVCNENACGRISCTNCFFVGGVDSVLAGGRLPEVSTSSVPCDLIFEVVNPNEDMCLGWTS